MGCKGCCSWPHGRVSVYAMLVSVCAFLFTISAGGCYYVKIQGFLETTSPYGVPTPGMTRTIGYFSFEDVSVDNYVCTTYTSDMLNASWVDGWFVAARVFGGIAQACTIVSMILLMVAGCVEFSVGAFKAIGILLVLASISSLLTFLLFGSDVCKDFGSCDFYIGAGFAIIASIISFVCALVVMKIPPAGPPTGPGAPEAFAPGTETVQETTLPDGTKKITKTTVNPDGSQTVEETIQKPE